MQGGESTGGQGGASREVDSLLMSPCPLPEAAGAALR